MTNPAVEALKPCPFCGVEAEVLSVGSNYIIVGCPGTKYQEMLCPRPSQIIYDHGNGFDPKWWNRRAQAEQTPVGGTGQEEWERLRDELDPPHKWSVGDTFNARGFFIHGWDAHKAQCLTSPASSGANPPGREAGRWVSPELFESVLRCVKRAGKEEDYQALRAAPSFPKEEL